MVQRATIAALAAILASSAARPAPFDHVLHEERLVGEGDSWVKGSRMEDNLKVPVRIGYALVDSNICGLSDLYIDFQF